MKLAIVGTGYVGLVTAAVFADLGHEVCGLDIDQDRIAKLQKGKIPFFEPGLAELVKQGLATGRLRFSTDPAEAGSRAGVAFISVGTPTKENGETDLSAVLTAAKTLAQHLKNGAVVVIKSTVPPKAHQQVIEVMAAQTNYRFQVAVCPEFLVEGKAVADTYSPARLVIGTDDAQTAQTLLDLHQGIGGQRIVCRPQSASIIKYAANIFLGLKVSFANILAELCEAYGADITEVVSGLAADPRIGPGHFGAGFGIGGSCIPKDTASFSQWVGEETTQGMFKAVMAVNNRQIGRGLAKVQRLLGSCQDKTIALLGLSFKPDTDDLREAPSLKLIKELSALGARLKVYDPQAMAKLKKKLPRLLYCAGPYEAVTSADLLILVTEWEEFRHLDWVKVKKLMKAPNVVDGRNLWARQELEAAGFKYEGFGR